MLSASPRFRLLKTSQLGNYVIIKTLNKTSSLDLPKRRGTICVIDDYILGSRQRRLNSPGVAPLTLLRRNCTQQQLHHHHQNRHRYLRTSSRPRIYLGPSGNNRTFTSTNASAHNMSADLIPANPADLMVIRNVTPNIATFSVPFSRFGRIKIGGRGTLGTSQFARGTPLYSQRSIIVLTQPRSQAHIRQPRRLLSRRPHRRNQGQSQRIRRQRRLHCRSRL